VALAAQMFSGKAELRPWFFDDRWHQPYRAKLMPGLSDVLEYRHQALLGTCVSGAGPTILAFARGDAAPIGEALCEVLSRKGIEAEAQVLAADNLGAKGWSLPA
jgi:homoserine kinase